eukprot:364943-Chlamydomonas_euryale.AAC.32
MTVWWGRQPISQPRRASHVDTCAWHAAGTVNACAWHMRGSVEACAWHVHGREQQGGARVWTVPEPGTLRAT